MKYLSNIRVIYGDLVEEAIEVSGRTDIHIDPYPMPWHWMLNRGDQAEPPPFTPETAKEIVENMKGKFFSLYVDTDCDCSSFWNAYEELRHSPKWQVYFKLSGAEDY